MHSFPFLSLTGVFCLPGEAGPTCAVHGAGVLAVRLVQVGCSVGRRAQEMRELVLKAGALCSRVRLLRNSDATRCGGWF